MISAIMEAVGAALRSEFADSCKVYTEETEQGLERPCFFISFVDFTDRAFLGGRRFRTNRFRIRYLPESEGSGKEGYYAVAERLLTALEWITVAGQLQMGTKMRYEVADGALHFFVNYDLFVCKTAEALPVMEQMERKLVVKG